MKYTYLIILLVFISCSNTKRKEAIINDVISSDKTKEWVYKNADSLLQKSTFVATNGLQMPYRLFSPSDLNETQKPLVIFLHGRGERGTDNSANIYNGAGMLMNSNSLLLLASQEKYPCYILVPQCSDKTENEEWAKWVGNSPETPFKGLGKDGSYSMNLTPSESGEAALELIQKTIKDNNIDANRIYLVGLSMGGFGVWEFTVRMPDLFAAAIPMAGYSDPSQIEKIKHIPYWIFHGDIDKWNPVEGSRKMHQLLTQANADVKYTEYKNTGHGDAFKKAFKEPDFIPWMFSKSKQNTNSTNTIAELEYKIEAELGEGAFWNHKTQELLWIDIEGKKLHSYNPKTKTNNTFAMPSRPGTVVPKNEKEVLIALEDGMHSINLETGSNKLFLDMTAVLSESRLNDGKCDPSGRLWVGSMHMQQVPNKAKLFMIDGSINYETKIDSVTISNGIVWTSDKKTMYYIDTPTSQIKAFDFDNETGTISNGRVAVQIPETLGYPDGMTIDEEDMLWVGMWNGNAVIRFNPITGKVDKKIEVPAHNITSCAFGGKDLDILYITSARVDMTEDELKKYPLSGSIFKIVPGKKGVKSTFFK